MFCTCVVRHNGTLATRWGGSKDEIGSTAVVPLGTSSVLQVLQDVTASNPTPDRLLLVTPGPGDSLDPNTPAELVVAMLAPLFGISQRCVEVISPLRLLASLLQQPDPTYRLLTGPLLNLQEYRLIYLAIAPDGSWRQQMADVTQSTRQVVVREFAEATTPSDIGSLPTFVANLLEPITMVVIDGLTTSPQAVVEDLTLRLPALTRSNVGCMYGQNFLLGAAWQHVRR